MITDPYIIVPLLMFISAVIGGAAVFLLFDVRPARTPEPGIEECLEIIESCTDALARMDGARKLTGPDGRCKILFDDNETIQQLKRTIQTAARRLQCRTRPTATT